MYRKLQTAEMNRLSTNHFIQAEKLPVTLIMDNIRSHLNVGSVFRSADSFRITEILLCGITGCPPHRDIQKTALGATESVRWQYFETTEDAISYCRQQGMKLYGVEQTESSMPLQEFKPESRQDVGFILGNEVAGVQQQILTKCDGVIEIPQYGTKHSLNVSVTAGILLWDMNCKIRFREDSSPQ